MEAKLLLKNRHSCRNFTEEKVKEEDLQLIIDAGLNAPTAKNRQDTKLIVIEDEKLIKKLSSMNADILGSNSDPFYGAKTIILVLVDRDNPFGELDAGSVMTMLQSEAYILGVGSCWINRLQIMMEKEEGKALLKEWGIENYAGVGICVLGYPAKEGNHKAIKENRVVRIR